MPFLDSFAESFSRSFNTSGWQTRGEREYQGAQTEHLRTVDELAREADKRAAAAETREAEKYAYERTQRPAAEAAKAAETEYNIQQGALAKEEAIRAKWLNDPEQQEREIRKTEADIDKAIADGKLTNAQADELIAQLPYAGAKVKAYIDNVNAQTRGSEADAEKKFMENELFFGGTLTPARRLYDDYIKKYGIPPPMAGYGEAGAIPEGETAPEPEGTTGRTRIIEPTVVEPAPRDAAGNLIEPPPSYAPTAIPPRPAYTEEAPPPAPSAPVRPPVGSPNAPLYSGMMRQRPGEIPYTAATGVQAPAGRVATPPPPARAPEPRQPAPTREPAYSRTTPQQPLPNTYRAAPGEAPSETPRPMYQPEGAIPGLQPAAYRPGKGRVIEAQAGTRRLPLNDRTRTMLEQASAATGLDVRVTSGAQPSSGAGRTGSHRHDVDVGAGDIQLIDKSTGEAVNASTPEGQQKVIEFMRAARDAGATGFGAGTDYMGDTTFHVGFGDPGVWGAGGKGANAPQWLRAGMEGGGGGRPSAIPQGTGSRPAGVARVYQEMQQLDIPQMQAAVFAGNIQQESGGDPNSLNEKEGAHGIMQWRGDRWEKLQAYAAEKGTSPNDLRTQIEFAVQEGETRGSAQDKAAWQEFMSATTPEAANAALKKFIRYGDNSAGTRLEYAENLLRSGGGEIRGERGTTEDIGGRQRMPTPRGEVAQNVRRQNIYTTSMQAAKDGLKAIYADYQPGAVPTQQSQQQLRNAVSGEGAASPQSMARAKEAVQRTATEPMSQAELNAATLAYAYDWAMMVEKDPAKAQGIAKEILNNYTRTANQYASLAKVAAQNGDLTKAVQLFAKGNDFIPNGKEVSAAQNEDGTYTLTTKNYDGKIVQEQVLTPDQIYAGIMGWNGTVDVHRELRKAAGEALPSAEYETQFGIPEEGAPVRERGSDVGINWPAMTKEEQEGARAIIDVERKGMPKAFTVEERGKIEEALGNLQQDQAYAADMEALTTLFSDRPNIINGLVQDIADNTDTDVGTIVSDLGHLSKSTADVPTGQLVEVDDADDTVTVHVDGSPVNLTMSVTAWQTITNALDRRSAGAQPPPDTAVRDADTAAEAAAAAAGGAAPPPPQYGPAIPAPTVATPRGPYQNPFPNMPSTRVPPLPREQPVPMVRTPRGPTPALPYAR